MTEPIKSPLRDQIAAAIYEHNNPGHRWADAHPDDLLAYGFDADAALAALLGPILDGTSTAEWTAVRAIQLMHEAGQQRDEAQAVIERVRVELGDPSALNWHARIRAAIDQPDEEQGKTTRVFAALHRSAEQDVSRVIDLYERWVKAGLPPFGVSLSRWWDARLVELHNAIQPPADQTTEK